nr:hypothetical protein [uncultured Carboxylicivirga sp.]
MDFFKSIDDIRKYVKIPASLQMVALSPAFRPAKRKVLYIIGKETYLLLLNHYNTPPEEKDAVLDQAVEYLQAVLANMMHIDWFKLESSERNATENKLYKYQEDQIIEIHIDNIWAEMDQLIDLLNSNTEKFSDFANTDIAKTRKSLVITNANTFDKYFGINSSSYFFMRSTYIQQEVITDMLVKRGVVVADISGKNDKYKYAINKATAYEVMAQACRRFEYAEFPPSIRQDITNEMKRSVQKFNQSSYIKETLFQQLHNRAMEYLGDLEDLIRKDASGTYEAPEEVNDESNKFFFTT